MKTDIPLPKTPQDWVEFTSTDADGDEQVYRVSLSFMLSNYRCIFGQGCPSILEKGVVRNTGCCELGVHFENSEDFMHVAEQVKHLTDDDWELKELGTKTPESWFSKNRYGGPNKTRIVDHACIFAGRSPGKEGCAFHRMAVRTGQSHTETKPYVCWKVPIAAYFDEDDVHVITGTSEDDWGGEDGINYWCMDTPDAYVARTFAFQNLEEELVKVMGRTAYDHMVSIIKARWHNKISPMPGQLRNEGRPMIPLIVKNVTGNNP